MKWKKTISLILTMTLFTVALAGCKGAQDSKGVMDDNADNRAMGRYIEEEYPLPEGVMNILSMKQLKDGTIRMAAEGEEGRAVWDSKDNGRTWEMAGSFPEEILTESQAVLSTVAVGPFGDIAVNYIDTTQSVQNVDQMKYDSLLFSPGSESKKLNISFPQSDYEGEEMAGGEDCVNQFLFTDDNQLLAIAKDGAVYDINQETGEIEKTIEATGDYITGAVVVGNKLLLFSNQEAAFYDIATGTKEKNDTALEEKLVKQSQQDEVTVTVEGSGFSSLAFALNQEKTALYYCNSDGLYRHVLDGTVCEQIINGNLNSLGNPGIGLVDLAALDDNSFLVGAFGEDCASLLHYYYDGSVPAMPEREVKLYTLNDSPQLRQAIANFQKDNPDVYLNMEVGISGNNGVTADDAMKTLNTTMMAGDGPDLLILDGMPVDSYIEKGMLEDVSEVLKDIKKKDGVFENVAATYETDGKVYAIPCSFMVPAIQGKAEDAGNISDLKSLAEAGERIKNRQPDASKILNTDSMEVFLGKIFQTFAHECQNEDGSFSEEKLETALTQIKRIYELNVHDEEDQSVLSVTEMQGGYSLNYDYSLSARSMDLLMGSCCLNFGYWKSLSGLDIVESVNETIGDGVCHSFSKEGHGVFVPCTIAGISSKGKNQEDAKAFLRYLLSGKAQGGFFEDGFSINKTVFDAEAEKEINHGNEASYLTISNENGETVDLTLRGITKDQTDALKKILEEADTPAITDSALQAVFIEQGVNVLKGTATAQEAAKEIVQKVNLYLSE